MLDGDMQGKAERARYIKDYGVSPNRMFTIDELVDGVANIEGLVASEASNIIRNELKLSETPNKGQMLRFFQERLAGENVVSLGGAFESRSKTLIDAIDERLKSLSSP